MARGCAMATIAILAMIMAGAAAQKANVLIVAGDSLSDTGNVLAVTSDEVPNPDYYFEGSFTNEPGAWAAQIDQENTTVATRNLAYGGATACNYPELTKTGIRTELLSVKQQVEDFKSKLNESDYFDTLIGGGDRAFIPVIWGGHNDLTLMANMSEQNATELPGRVVECLRNATRELLRESDRLNFTAVVLATVLPLDQTPAYANSSEALATLIAAVNEGITAFAASLSNSSSLNGTSVILWDTNALVSNIIANYSALGFTYTNQSCLTYDSVDDILNGTTPTSVCEDPSQYVFYDPVHPSAAVHTLLYQDLVNILQQNNALVSNFSTDGDSAVFSPPPPALDGNDTIPTPDVNGSVPVPPDSEAPAAPSTRRMMKEVRKMLIGF